MNKASLGFLSADQFKVLLRDGILVAIDLIVKNEKDEVLLGLRKNAPAQDFWFVPGGRIFKNEPVAEALERVMRAELGSGALSEGARFLGVFDHIYSDNVFGDSSFGTHYIVLGYEVRNFRGDLKQMNIQHEQFKFVAIQDLLSDPKVHQFTKNYFLKRA